MNMHTQRERAMNTCASQFVTLWLCMFLKAVQGMSRGLNNE